MSNMDIEYNYVKELLNKHNFPKGLVAWGSARIPYDDPHIQEIISIAEDCARYAIENKKDISFITGGGPSVMTAWMEKPFKMGLKTGGMALELPMEKKDDQLKYCTPELSFTFENFASRKRIMLENAKVIVVFKGGYGTMDELFEAVTMIKTHKMPEVPIFIYPQDFYSDVLNLTKFIDAGTITKKEADIFRMFNSKEELTKALYKMIDA